ncbi:MAG: WYL domain-containing protein [Bacteroidetes bacterium]|nr:MAG: WYL domain-containing protein [Bacteroidota bacterium]
MPANRNALLRYMTIDNCLKNRFRKWTLEDLIDAVSEALYEYEGIDKGVSKRTVQMDIQMMRSEKLGYHAPIIITEKKYYTYEDPDYSITNIPLTDQDLYKLNEAVNLLKQFKGFSHFEDLGAMVQKLEDKVQVSKTKGRPIIDMESNEHLTGLHWMELLYQAILQRKQIDIQYQSFKAREGQNIRFHPGLLKEYQNRWFVLGHRHNEKNYQLLALDRMQDVAIRSEEAELGSEEFFLNYFKDVIGVSVNLDTPAEKVRFFASMESAPYLLTKPLHASQKLVERNHFGMLFEMEVQHNFELEKALLGLGETIRVLEPSRLRRRLFDRTEASLKNYRLEMNKEVLAKLPNILSKNGFILLSDVFSERACRHLLNVAKRLSTENPNLTPRKLAELTQAYWHLESLDRVLQRLELDPALADSYFNLRSMKSEQSLAWQQSNPCHSWIIRIQLKKEQPGEKPLHLFRGVHRRTLSENEIELLLEQGADFPASIPHGGILIMHPNLAHQGELFGPGSHSNTFQLLF